MTEERFAPEEEAPSGTPVEPAGPDVVEEEDTDEELEDDEEDEPSA